MVLRKPNEILIATVAKEGEDVNKEVHNVDVDRDGGHAIVVRGELEFAVLPTQDHLRVQHDVAS